MIKYNISKYITILSPLSILLFVTISLIRNNLSYLGLNSIWENITTTITIVTVLCTIFATWAWKLKIFQGWLVPFPSLSGEWKGVIVSTYQSKNTEIPIHVIIKHNFFNIQIQIKTKESSSISTCGSFDIDEYRGLKQLLYSYQNYPKATVRDKSQIHYGTTRLEISSNAKILKGEYWTSRKTTGDIKLNKIK